MKKYVITNLIILFCLVTAQIACMSALSRYKLSQLAQAAIAYVIQKKYTPIYYYANYMQVLKPIKK